MMDEKKIIDSKSQLRSIIHDQIITIEQWSIDVWKTLFCGNWRKKQDAGFFLFGCSEMTSAWLITSKLAYQNAWKALFAWVV